MPEYLSSDPDLPLDLINPTTALILFPHWCHLQQYHSTPLIGMAHSSFSNPWAVFMCLDSKLIKDGLWVLWCFGRGSCWLLILTCHPVNLPSHLPSFAYIQMTGVCLFLHCCSKNACEQNAQGQINRRGWLAATIRLAQTSSTTKVWIETTKIPSILHFFYSIQPIFSLFQNGYILWGCMAADVWWLLMILLISNWSQI